jgi:hypothetical protein
MGRFEGEIGDTMTSESVNGTELFECDLEPCGQHHDHRWNRLRTIISRSLCYIGLQEHQGHAAVSIDLFPMPLILSLASIPRLPCHRNSHSPGSKTGAGSHGSYPESLSLSCIPYGSWFATNAWTTKQRWPPEVSTKSKHSNNAPCIPTVQLLSSASVPDRQPLQVHSDFDVGCDIS